MPKEKLTRESVKQAVKLVENGASNADVIAMLGVNESTFYRWLKNPKSDNQRQLCKDLKKAAVKRKLWHVQRITEAANNGKWQASAWYLERCFPQEFGQAQRITIDTSAEDNDKSIKEFIGALGLR